MIDKKCRKSLKYKEKTGRCCINSAYYHSLHDMKICKIESIDKLLKIYFKNGYVACAEPYRQVNGNISIEQVDYEFSYAYLLSDYGDLGTFNGQKFALLDFLREYTNFSFEVIDENYGYNSVIYNGYLNLPEKENLIELTLTIYHFGNIIYETEQ